MKKISLETKEYLTQLNLDQLIEETIQATVQGKIELIHYLLTSKDLKENPSINLIDKNNQNDSLLQIACMNNNLMLVKFLLTSNKLIEHSDIHFDDDIALRSASMMGNTDIMEFMLNDTSLKHKANIHAHNDFCLINNIANRGSSISSVKKRSERIINLLIFKCNIDINENINNFLEQYNLLDIIAMFNNRELEKKLNKDLELKTATKIKIKI